jgi:hypothetical protein
MRTLTLSQWNFLWTRGNGGCTWQGTDEKEVREHVGPGYEMVRIKVENYPDMFGVVVSSRVDDIKEGRI